MQTVTQPTEGTSVARPTGVIIGKHPKNGWKKNMFIISLIIVPLLQFAIFYLYVNFNSFVMAFQTIEEGETVFSLDNFRMLFDELGDSASTAMVSLRNTGIFFVQGFITGIITGFVITYFLYKKIPLSGPFRILLFIPSLLSAVVVTTLFKNVVEINGPIAYYMKKFMHLDSTPLLLGEKKYALKTLLFYNIWFGIAGNMVLYMGAFNRIPKDVLEYAKLDGVGWVREMVQIVVPLMWPTIVTLITVQFTGIFGASGPIFLFTQGKHNTYTIAYWLWEKVYLAVNPDSPMLNYASAIGMFFTLVALPIVFGVRWLLGKVQAAVEY